MSQVTRFVGPIPELYDRHLGPVIFEPYARDLAARVPSTTRRLLEIAAGTGRVTRHLLATLAGDAELVASDLNQPMLDEARRRLPDDPRLRLQVADAQALPFEDAAFDAVACQFGLMFMPDKPLALREMRRVLRRGGLLLLSTWDDLARNPATAMISQLALALPGDPPTFMNTPFSMPDPIALRGLVEAAGFASVTVETVAQIGEAVSADDLAIGMVRGNPLWNQLSERGIDGEAFQRRAAEVLREAYGDAPCRSTLSAHVVTASA